MSRYTALDSGITRANVPSPFPRMFLTPGVDSPEEVLSVRMSAVGEKL
jgi:hypothetical protein